MRLTLYLCIACTTFGNYDSPRAHIRLQNPETTQKRVQIIICCKTSTPASDTWALQHSNNDGIFTANNEMLPGMHLALESHSSNSAMVAAPQLRRGGAIVSTSPSHGVWSATLV